MLLDFHFTSCRRQCSATGRQLEPGETYYSALVNEDGSPERCDFAAEAWQGPPAEHIAWWKSRIPDDANTRPQLAPSDVLLNLFLELADQPDEAEFRYLLGLMLIRKKVVRLLESCRDEHADEVLTLDCPRRQQQYELLVVEPNAECVQQLQLRIVDLLYNDGK